MKQLKLLIVLCTVLTSSLSKAEFYYHLVCRGGGKIAVGSNFSVGKQEATLQLIAKTYNDYGGIRGEHLPAGSCSWPDRAFYSDEPQYFAYDVPVSDLLMSSTLYLDGSTYKRNFTVQTPLDILAKYGSHTIFKVYVKNDGNRMTIKRWELL